MKHALPISLVLNLVLATGVVCLWKPDRSPEDHISRSSSPLMLPSTSQSGTNKALNAKQVASPVPDFRWSQLESPDNYREYVANLRATGCPEATVEDIVRGDTARAFALKRHELGLSAAGNGPWSLKQENALVSDLLQKRNLANHSHTGFLPGNESPSEPTKFATTAGSSSLGTVPSQDVSSQPEAPMTSAASSSSSLQQDDRSSSQALKRIQPFSSQAVASHTMASPTYPAVLQNVDWNALGLSDAQKTAVEQLRQQFIQDVGGTDQNPNNPAYLARWQKAQPQSDYLFKAMLGVTAWENFQLLATDSGADAQNPYSASATTP